MMPVIAGLLAAIVVYLAFISAKLGAIHKELAGRRALSEGDRHETR